MPFNELMPLFPCSVLTWVLNVMRREAVNRTYVFLFDKQRLTTTIDVVQWQSPQKAVKTRRFIITIHCIITVIAFLLVNCDIAINYRLLGNWLICLQVEKKITDNTLSNSYKLKKTHSPSARRPWEFLARWLAYGLLSRVPSGHEQIVA